jgi:DNA-binding ferritin-like protein
MPTNVVHTPRDEEKWNKAKELAKAQGHKEDYAYIMGIYRKMNPSHEFKTANGTSFGVVLLPQLLGCMQAMYHMHWISHWKVKGTPYYGDHLLFQRLYESMPNEIDGLAEKIVSMYGPDIICPNKQASYIQKWISEFMSTSSGSNSDPNMGIIDRQLSMENRFQNIIKVVYKKLEAAGELSLGLDDFLQALANAHETHQYLLRQRGRVITAYKKRAMDHPSEEAKRDYLHEHPNADPADHKVEQKTKLDPHTKIDQDRAKSLDTMTKKLGIPKEDAELLIRKSEKGGSKYSDEHAFNYLFPKAKKFDFRDLAMASEYSDEKLKSQYGISKKELDKYYALSKHLFQAESRGAKQRKLKDKMKKKSNLF